MEACIFLLGGWVAGRDFPPESPAPRASAAVWQHVADFESGRLPPQMDEACLNAAGLICRERFVSGSLAHCRGLELARAEVKRVRLLFVCGGL